MKNETGIDELCQERNDNIVKYKLLICVDSFWPFQDGVSIVTQYLAKGIQRRGNEVMVYTNKRGMDLRDREIFEGIIIKRHSVVSHWPMSITGTDDNSNPQSYMQVISEFEPDVLLIESYGNWQLDWLFDRIKLIDCKKILHFHSIYPDGEKYHIINSLLKRNYYNAKVDYQVRKYWKKAWKEIKFFDLVLHLYKNSGSWNACLQHDINQNAVLENAVDDIFFSEEMYHKHCQKDETIFLSVANYNDNKNQKMIIEAYKTASLKGKTKLICIGNRETKYLEMLQEAADKVNEEGKKVILYVGLERRQVLDEFREADVLVLSSKREGSPVVLREAAATAMGIISTNTGDAELIDGVEIVYGIDDMVNSMVKMQDAAYRKNMGERARNWAMKHCDRNEKVEWLDKRILSMLER